MVACWQVMRSEPVNELRSVEEFDDDDNEELAARAYGEVEETEAREYEDEDEEIEAREYDDEIEARDYEDEEIEE